MRFLAASLALLLAGCGPASSAPDVRASDAWSPATAPVQTSAATYFTIDNAGGSPDRLVSVATPMGAASLHESSLSDGIARMRPLASVTIPAGGRVELKPGGTHVMVMGLKQPLREGLAYPMTLRFERSGDRLVSVAVRSASAAYAPSAK